MKIYRLKSFYDDELVEDSTPFDWLLSLGADKAILYQEYERERGTAATITMISIQFLDERSELLFSLLYSDWISYIEEVEFISSRHRL
jgi:hypothetical protein